MIKALHDAGKKVIFVNCSGSPIAMEAETEHCQAILQAWYPGQSGGKAVAEVLFGDYTLPDVCRLRSTAACRNCPTSKTTTWQDIPTASSKANRFSRSDTV